MDHLLHAADAAAELLTLVGSIVDIPVYVRAQVPAWRSVAYAFL